MSRCTKISKLTGTPCDLEEGHDGKHSRTYTERVPKPYTVQWSEESDNRVLDIESNRKQGT